MDNKLVPYIQTALSQGKTKDDIYKDLLKVGWSVDAITSAFSVAQKPSSNENTVPLPSDSRASVPETVSSVMADKGTDTAPHQKTARVVLTIGAIFIGLGIFSFIAGNWQKMDSMTKVLVIVAAMLVSYTLAFIMNFRGYSRTGNAFLLLGSLIYGAGLFLIAQIFHLPIEWPDGFLLWFVGVVALGYAVEWRPLINFATVLGFIGGVGYPWRFFDSFVYLAGNRNPLGATTVSILLLVVALTASILVALHIRSRLPAESREKF